MKTRSLDDPLPIGDLLRLKSMAIVTVEGVDYYMDVFCREFRLVERPRVGVKFDSPAGEEMFRQLRQREWGAGQEAAV